MLRQDGPYYFCGASYSGLSGELQDNSPVCIIHLATWDFGIINACHHMLLLLLLFLSLFSPPLSWILRLWGCNLDHQYCIASHFLDWAILLISFFLPLSLLTYKVTKISYPYHKVVVFHATFWIIDIKYEFNFVSILLLLLPYFKIWLNLLYRCLYEHTSDILLS